MLTTTTPASGCPDFAREGIDPEAFEDAPAAAFDRGWSDEDEARYVEADERMASVWPGHSVGNPGCRCDGCN